MNVHYSVRYPSLCECRSLYKLAVLLLVKFYHCSEIRSGLLRAFWRHERARCACTYGCCCVKRNPRKRVLFLALAGIGLVEQDEEEQEHATQRQRRRLFGKLFAGPYSTPQRYDRLMRRAAPVSAPRK